MNLSDSLSEATVLLDISSHEKNKVIADVANLLRSSPAVNDFDAFLGAVYAREMQAATGIGHGVAIPHARTDSVSDFVAALGISREGVDFEAVDGESVKLVILMGIPTFKVKAYLRLLAHMSLLLKRPGFLGRVLDAQSAREVLDAFAEYEG
jgi:mannitol/fructose-specific phosphotransferase system IIA component (Ntr-type)